MRPYKLTLGDAAAIRAQSARTSATPPRLINRGDLKEVSEFSSAGGPVWASRLNFPEIRNLPIAQGRFFDAGRHRPAAPGRHPRPEEQRPALPRRPSVGSYITINGYRFLVIGVAGKIGRGNNDGDNQKIYIPLTTMMDSSSPSPAKTSRETPSPPSSTSPPTEDLNETAKAEVHRIIAAATRLRPRPTKTPSRSGTPSSPAARSASSSPRWTIFLGGVGIVTLALGAVGIINIMLVTVSERTKEIGLRKALGATNRSILIQFFLEGLTLTGLSGVIGIAAAAALMLALGQCRGQQRHGLRPATARALVRRHGPRHPRALRRRRRHLPRRQAAMLEPVEALRKE